MRLRRALVAEFVGTALLVCAVVGSGVMGARLSGGNVALTLLANTLATGAALIALIAALAPVSGAHFNPAVTLVETLLKRISAKSAGLYILAQLGGGVVGVLAAHAMFDLPWISFSEHVRTGPSQWFSEVLASFGLVVVILQVGRSRADFVPIAVGAYIMAGYWFTASTSFANPAVALARSLSDTFSGIRPVDVPGFVVSELVGAVFGLLLYRWMSADAQTNPS